ncbi:MULTISPECIES: hypothetical protein [Bacteroidales]|jgi:hypothetical protein|uniref:hypothetical protein n=1 Tax=Bacteroidales TaxID=171549 RepID=UPI00155E6175|nr:hypothetical protein [Phocaeicola vulgatus]NMX08798.1 hypothetical protein [Phocaeicola vulgatus]
MGLDILLYNKSGEREEIFEINENFHYWLFNKAGLNKSSFSEIFKIQDYYKTNVQLVDEQLQQFICELEKLEKEHPSEYINSILNKLKQKDIVKIRITGD